MKVEHPWQNTKTNLSGSHYCSLDTNDEMEQFLKDDLISKSQSQKFNQMLVSDFFLLKYSIFSLDLNFYVLYVQTSRIQIGPENEALNSVKNDVI